MINLFASDYSFTHLQAHLKSLDLIFYQSIEMKGKVQNSYLGNIYYIHQTSGVDNIFINKNSCKERKKSWSKFVVTVVYIFSEYSMWTENGGRKHSVGNRYKATNSSQTTGHSLERNKSFHRSILVTSKTNVRFWFYKTTSNQTKSSPHLRPHSSNKYSNIDLILNLTWNRNPNRRKQSTWNRKIKGNSLKKVLTLTTMKTK